MGELGYNTIFWSIAIGVLLFFSIFFFLKMRKDEIKSQKIFSLGLGFFFLLNALSRVFFIYSDYAESVLFDASLYDLVWRIAQFCGLSGFIFLTIVIEFFILEKKTKFIFTIIGIITLIGALVTGPEIGRQIISYGAVWMGLIILLLYIYISIKTRGYVRKRSLQAFFGMIIFFAGIVLDGTLVIDFFGDIAPSISAMTIRSIAGILLCIGVITFGLANRKTEE